MPVRLILTYAFSAICAVLAALYCYGFGVRISGPGLGFLLAVNGAMFAAMVAGALVEWVLPPSKPKQGSDGHHQPR